MKKFKGFTIVELVVVIAIIALLAGVLVPVFNGIIAKAEYTSALNEVKNTLNLLNAECIASTGQGLPDGVVMKNNGYTFVYFNGGLYEIIPAGHIDMGGENITLWVSSGANEVINEIADALCSSPRNPLTVTVDGIVCQCTNFGCVKTDNGEYYFAFSTDIDIAPTSNIKSTSVFAGTAVKTLDLIAVPENLDDTPEVSDNISDVTENAPDISDTDDNSDILHELPDNASNLPEQPEKFSYIIKAANCQVNNPGGEILPDDDLQLTFVPDKYYELKGSVISVKVAGFTLAANEYMWNTETGTLTIPGGVITGDVEISVEAKRKTHQIVLSSLSGINSVEDANGVISLDRNGGFLVYEGENYTFYINGSFSNPKEPVSYIEVQDTCLTLGTDYHVSTQSNRIVITIEGEKIIGPIYIFLNN